jgi:hypothetical protein
MTRLPTMISDDALAVENNENTATAIPPSSQTPLSTSPRLSLDSQCKEPFRPTAWRDLTSIVRRPQHWQVDSWMPSSKTTKMPLKYCQHTTTRGSSHVSSPKDSALPRPRLLKGWAYKEQEVSSEVKTEVVDPAQYQMLASPLTHNKRKAVDQLDDPHHRHRWALSITEAPPSYPSASKKTAVKYRRVTSGLTSMRPIHS